MTSPLCSYSTDPEMQDISRLDDARMVTQCRAARKGVIIRAERQFTIFNAASLETLCTSDLEKRLTELQRSVDLHEALQARYEILTTDSSKPEAELEAVDCTWAAHAELLTNYAVLLEQAKLYYETVDIRQSVEDYEDMTSLKEFASEIQALKTRADALHKECFQYKGTLQDMGTEPRKLQPFLSQLQQHPSSDQQYFIQGGGGGELWDLPHKPPIPPPPPN